MEYEDDIELLISAGFTRRRSSTSIVSLSLMKETRAYRELVIGGKMVGKTAIISQFMKDKFPQSYKSTIQEMQQRDFKIKLASFASFGNIHLCLIQVYIKL